MNLDELDTIINKQEAEAKRPAYTVKYPDLSGLPRDISCCIPPCIRVVGRPVDAHLGGVGGE